MTRDTRKPPSKRTYEVGYGKPPVSGRFVKGVSGNPRGRPRKTPRVPPPPDTSVRDSFLEEAERVIQLREGDKVFQMTVADAVRRAEAIAALKGNTHAQRNFLEREARYKKELADEIEAQQASWRRYIDRYGAPGATIPKGLPHPEDVIIAPGKPVSFRFGVDPEEAEKHCRTFCRFRDASLVQAEIDDRCHRRKRTPGYDHKVPVSLIFAICANLMLPNRHRHDQDTFGAIQLTHMSLRQSELEKRRHEALCAIGLNGGEDVHHASDQQATGRADDQRDQTPTRYRVARRLRSDRTESAFGHLVERSGLRLMHVS